jgi:hypothetical protein
MRCGLAGAAMSTAQPAPNAVCVYHALSQNWSSQKCWLSKKQLVRFERSRLEISWDHGLVDRDYNSAMVRHACRACPRRHATHLPCHAQNILRKALAQLRKTNDAAYLADSRGDKDWKPIALAKPQPGCRLLSHLEFQRMWHAGTDC